MTYVHTSKWSVSVSSLWLTFSENNDTESLMKRWAMCCDNKWSISLSMSFWYTFGSYIKGTSLYFSPWGERYESMESYLDLFITNLLSFKGFKPRSSSVRQSTEQDMMFHRQSTSVKKPRCTGEAAVKASWK